MANYRAVATGNWSAGATWGGGAVPPDAAGHNIYSNGFTVTIDQNVNVALITNAANAGTFVGGGTAAAGGGFSMPNAFNVTSNVASSTATCLTISASTGTITMSGSSLSTATTSTSAVLLTSTATLNMTGYTCPAPGATFSYAVALSGNGTINLTSFIVNGSGGAGTIYNIINSSSSGTINFYTSTINPSNTICVLNNATGFMSFTNCILNGGGSSTAIGISNSGTITVTGGNVNAGSNGVAISSTGTLTVTGASINATNGASAISSSGTARISGTFVNATNGQQAVFSSRWILNTAPTASYIQQALDGINAGSYVRFYTADNTSGITGVATTDVRLGVSYGGGLVGTCAVPPASSVGYGVAVGQTTGTAALTPADVATAVWGAVSRTITGGTVTTLTNSPNVPSAASIASQVRTELTSELSKVSALNTDRLAQCATTSIVGNLIAQSNS